MPAAREVPVQLTVNGARRAATVPARTLLVHFLRDHLRLTGTHVGCDTTQCGACTVALDGVAVKSCTVLAAQADGHEITTIEGLAIPGEGALDPVQQAFQDEHALQCGYCTPGMVMAIRQLIADHPNPAEDEVRHALSGNICRCTGYQNIVAAALRAAQPAAAQPAAAQPAAAQGATQPAVGTAATQPAADHAAEPPAGPAATQRAVANAAEPPVAESLHDNRTAGKREG